MIILKNDFHDTYARTRGGRLNRENVCRIRRALCPSWAQGCVCGGPLGERGPQSAWIEPHYDGTGEVTVTAYPLEPSRENIPSGAVKIGKGW